MWYMVWWYRLGLSPNLSTRALWQPPVLSGGPVSRDISGASGRMGEVNENLVYPCLWDFKRFLICRKILRHGNSRFTSHPKEDVLRIFIALKLHRLFRVWTRDLWVLWQAHEPLHDQGDSYGVGLTQLTEPDFPDPNNVLKSSLSGQNPEEELQFSNLKDWFLLLLSLKHEFTI
jgi:hypothetical protein